jgi:pilus assembly protein CpaE
VKISIVSENTKNLEELRRFVEADKRHEVKVFTGGVAMLGPVADQHAPDALILETNGANDSEFDSLSRLNLTHPSITLVLLSADQSPELLLHAMRAGVREVLPSPASRDALNAAIGRVDEKRAMQNPSREKGKILCFIPCKGGSGSTFLATNLAYILAAQEGKKVIVLDLSLQFGDAALFISDHKPATNLAEVARQILRMDAAFLSASLLPVLPNLGVLAAPEDPVQAMEVKPEHVDTLLNLARYQYDIVVVDIGRALDPVSIKALDQADAIFPVLQITLPFIRDAKRMLDVFRSLGYPRDKIKLLVNRYESGGDIRLEDVERTLGLSVFKTLPNSFRAVATSVNQGVAICKLSPKNPVTRSLQEFAKMLVRSGEAEAGWWNGLLQRK